MFFAASYHAVGAVSEGHLFVIVATAFWTCGSNPFLNLTTKVFGSVYLDSAIKSRNRVGIDRAEFFVEFGLEVIPIQELSIALIFFFPSKNTSSPFSCSSQLHI